jgi:hypothetical protein
MRRSSRRSNATASPGTAKSCANRAQRGSTPTRRRLRAAGTRTIARARAASSNRHASASGERVYPGTCRDGIPADRRERAQRAVAVRVEAPHRRSAIGSRACKRKISPRGRRFRRRRRRRALRVPARGRRRRRAAGRDARRPRRGPPASTPRQICSRACSDIPSCRTCTHRSRSTRTARKLSKQTRAAPLPDDRCRRFSPHGVSSSSAARGIERRIRSRPSGRGRRRWTPRDCRRPRCSPRRRARGVTRVKGIIVSFPARHVPCHAAPRNPRSP